MGWRGTGIKFDTLNLGTNLTALTTGTLELGCDGSTGFLFLSVYSDDTFTTWLGQIRMGTDGTITINGPGSSLILGAFCALTVVGTDSTSYNISIGSVAPTPVLGVGPNEGDIWIDNSGAAAAVKMWDGAAWV
jgi:hypothetical protein